MAAMRKFFGWCENQKMVSASQLVACPIAFWLPLLATASALVEDELMMMKTTGNQARGETGLKIWISGLSIS